MSIIVHPGNNVVFSSRLVLDNHVNQTRLSDPNTVFSGGNFGTQGDPFFRRGYVHFDNPILPDQYDYIHWRLGLGAATVPLDGPYDIDIYYLYEDYNINTLTWNNQPAIVTSPVLTVTTISDNSLLVMPFHLFLTNETEPIYAVMFASDKGIGGALDRLPTAAKF